MLGTVPYSISSAQVSDCGSVEQWGRILNGKPENENGRLPLLKMNIKERERSENDLLIWVWAPNSAGGVTQVLVHVSTYQGSILVPVF